MTLSETLSYFTRISPQVISFHPCSQTYGYCPINIAGALILLSATYTICYPWKMSAVIQKRNNYANAFLKYYTTPWILCLTFTTPEPLILFFYSPILAKYMKDKIRIPLNGYVHMKRKKYVNDKHWDVTLMSMWWRHTSVDNVYNQSTYAKVHDRHTNCL